MKAEDLILDHCSQGQVVKKFCEALPDVSVSILAKALIVETVTKNIKSHSKNHLSEFLHVRVSTCSDIQNF